MSFAAASARLPIAGWARLAGLRLHGWMLAERGRFAPWLAVLMGAGALAFFTLGFQPPGWWIATAPLASIALCVAAWRVPIPRAGV